jgi:hypothetical protein
VDVGSAQLAVASLNPAAERMRRHRQRRRDGLHCLSLELRETEIDALIRMRLLNGDNRRNPNAIRDALYAFLDNALDKAA